MSPTQCVPHIKIQSSRFIRDSESNDKFMAVKHFNMRKGLPSDDLNSNLTWISMLEIFRFRVIVWISANPLEHCSPIGALKRIEFFKIRWLSLKEKLPGTYLNQEPILRVLLTLPQLRSPLATSFLWISWTNLVNLVNRSYGIRHVDSLVYKISKTRVF